MMRGVAALIVAAMHTREITWVGIRQFWELHGFSASPGVIVGYLTFPLVWGSIGVPIFFVISGYCIHRGQAFARARNGVFQLGLTNFYLRRFFRIYPVLFAALLLTLGCDWISSHYYPHSYKLGDTDTRIFIVNLLSLQGISGPFYGSNLPLWTLSIEVQFYLLYPLLLTAMAWLGNSGTFFVLAFMNVASYFVLERRGYQLFSSYYISWYLGALVAEAEARNFLYDRLSSTALRSALYGLSIATLSAGCILLFVFNYVAFQVWAFSFATFLFVVLAFRRGSRGKVAKFFQSLGVFSFSLYIIHMPVVVLVHSIFYNSANQASIVPFFVILLAAIGCAFVFSVIFERPALALSQTFRGRRQLVESSVQ